MLYVGLGLGFLIGWGTALLALYYINDIFPDLKMTDS